jgi:predicted dehydrogenase
MMESTIQRRTFLQAGLSLPAIGVVASAAPAPARSGKLRLAVVGVGGRGNIFLKACLDRDDTDITALCDIRPDAAARGAGLVKGKRDREPALYTGGPEDYLRLVRRDDVDAVFVTTPANLHAAIAVAALKADKWVFSEVPACYTVREGRDLVEAARRSRGRYFLAENYCLTRPNMTVLRMVEKGLFGTLTYAECGYIHDCRSLLFDKAGEFTWRGQVSCDPRYGGNAYPTHSLGPVSTWFGITRGERFTRCIALESPAQSRHEYAVRRFGLDSPQARISTWRADTVQSLVQTESGALISIRYDTASPRPHHMAMYSLQGSRGCFDDEKGIHLEGDPAGWSPIDKYQAEHEHPWWRTQGTDAGGAGHGGGDYFTVRHFLDCIRHNRAPAFDVYDAVTWSALAELSMASAAAGGTPQPYPDFTEGEWKTRKRYEWPDLA